MHVRKLGGLVVAVVVGVAVAGCAHGKGDDETHEAKLSQDQVPAAVSSGFQRDFPGATITEVEKETYKDGTVHYEVDYKDASGKKQEVEYTADGEKLDKH